MTDIKKLPGSKVSFNLTIQDEELQSASESVIERYRKNISIKGFRKGKAPKKHIIAQVGLQTLMDEAFEKVLNNLYMDFLKKHKLSPVSSPKVDMGDMEKKPIKATVEVEVFPEVVLKDYKKIKVKKPSIKVTDKDVTEVVETILVDAKKGSVVKRAAKNKDLVKVDFAGKNKAGEIQPRTEGKDVVFRLGVGHFLPDLEKAIIGMKAGDAKEKVPVKFPKDYHAADMAGVTVYFDVTVHEVQEIDPKEIPEELIEQMLGEKKSDKEFREHLRGVIEQNKKSTAEKAAVEEYKRDLVKKTKVELPESWINAEVRERMQQLQQSPGYLADPGKFWDRVGKTEDQMVAEFRSQAEFGLASYLALSELVKQEAIELDKDEQMAVHSRVHQRMEQGARAGHDQLMERETLEAMVDKHLRSLFL